MIKIIIQNDFCDVIIFFITNGYYWNVTLDITPSSYLSLLLNFAFIYNYKVIYIGEQPKMDDFVSLENFLTNF